MKKNVKKILGFNHEKKKSEKKLKGGTLKTQNPKREIQPSPFCLVKNMKIILQ